MRIAASLVLGVFLGLVGAMLQTFTMRTGSVTLPVGAVLVLVATVPIARTCAWWASTRWAGVAFSVGWVGATLMMGTTTPGGDLVLSSGTRQVAYLIVGTMLLSAASAFPLLPEEEQPSRAGAQVGADDA